MARALAAEKAERERMEIELRLSQKLEAIGQLAAGIAHEINTPIQYVGDNLAFIREATSDLLRVVGATPCDDPDIDLGYIRHELPGALESIEHGVARIATIVRAMKELSHPGPREATLTDLNHSLANALEVTASSYRYVADVATDFGSIPAVTCYPAELNQVFLNLIVNAAHAMEDRPEGHRGTLGLRTRRDGDDVVVSISDTGSGIPAALHPRIFDAFFTTKEVGKGTGQGLAISRAIVVERHHGALTFETAVGVGTTFHVRLPVTTRAVLAAD
jgi:signal transduction histidine kinase